MQESKCKRRTISEAAQRAEQPTSLVFPIGEAGARRARSKWTVEGCTIFLQGFPAGRSIGSGADGEPREDFLGGLGRTVGLTAKHQPRDFGKSEKLPTDALTWQLWDYPCYRW